MTDHPQEPMGGLSLDMASPSFYLGRSLPFEVRDARQELVATGTGGWSGALPAGLYSVTGMDSSGSRVRDLVEVLPGGSAHVTLGDRRSAPHPPINPPTIRPAVPPPQATGSGAVGGAQLLAAEGCVALPDADGWLFLPEPPLQSVPTALFVLDGRQHTLSLPLNPQSQVADEAGCRADVVEAGHERRLQVSFAPGRRVTTFFAGARDARNVESAGDMLAEATELLLWKYRDPAGATLAGLALQRLGALRQRADWVANLAHDFRWIPDAHALQACVLLDTEGETAALEALLPAAFERPMYTDGLSLMLDILRQSGDDEAPGRKDERMAAIRHLGDLAAWADWDSISLSTSMGDAA